MTSRVRRLAAATATLALLGLVGAACSAGDESLSSGDDGGSGGSVASGPAPAAEGAGDGSAVEAPAPADGDVAALRDSPASGAFAADSLTQQYSSTAAEAGTSDGAPGPEAQPGPAPGDARSLVKKGNVAYRASDVRDARFEVLKVLQKRGGEIAEESTESNDEGVAERALMTLRVPVEAFEETMTDLEGVAATQGVEVIDAGSSSVDVSTQVIDVGVRVELQRRSIERISVLLDRASSIRDIVGIERELARREADLGSLQKRQAFLADQTSLSTISISIERPREKKAEEPETKVEGRSESGFLAGLDGGWDAFTDGTTALLTATGALLPFAVVALLVGVPLRVWWRRRRADGALAAGGGPVEASAAS
jgi:hypothetical protein